MKQKETPYFSVANIRQELLSVGLGGIWLVLGLAQTLSALSQLQRLHRRSCPAMSRTPFPWSRLPPLVLHTLPPSSSEMMPELWRSG